MNELIFLEQPAIIKERLARLKQRWEQKAADAEAMACTEETRQSLKAFRAEMRKEFSEVDALRMQIKRAFMEPYEKFEAIYKECVRGPFKSADDTCIRKLSAVESAMKQACEESLRDYFDELKTAHRVEWLQYEQAGIKIGITDATAKTPKKLREQLVCFVVRVASDVDTISTMENAEKILAEYKKSLNLASAIATVFERDRREEEERQALDTRSTARAAEIEAERRIDALVPPAIVKPPEKDPDEVMENVPFKIIKATRRQIWRLKEFMEKEGISYA